MARRRSDLRLAVVQRLQDGGAVWPTEELDRYVQEGLEEMADRTRAWWDLLYLDAAAGQALVDLPARVTEVERATWDDRQLAAYSRRTLRLRDPRFETSRGPVDGYVWRGDGVRTLRLIRVPSEGPTTIATSGSWGSLRNPLNSEAVSGSWGLVRRVAGHHPIGYHAHAWLGALRRIVLDLKNVRVEHWRQARPLDGDAPIELPDRYVAYLGDFVQWRCFLRAGPGQDLQLAEHYHQRWERGMARMIRRRLITTAAARERIFGGGRRAAITRPARPQLPPNFGVRLR
jgi:hypothetical protein